MIAPSVMNLTALHALADDNIWMIDDDARAIVVDPGEPQPLAEALDSRRLGLPAILMIDFAAHTAGHIAYSDHGGAGEPIVLRGDTLYSAAMRTWKNEFR